MASLVVSIEAQEDVRAIIAYLRTRVGDAMALEYLEAFDRAVDRLADFPGAGTPKPELGAEARITSVPPYTLIYDYRQAEGAVTLLRVVHGRRNITIDMIVRR